MLLKRITNGFSTLKTEAQISAEDGCHFRSQDASLDFKLKLKMGANADGATILHL